MIITAKMMSDCDYTLFETIKTIQSKYFPGKESFSLGFCVGSRAKTKAKRKRLFTLKVFYFNSYVLVLSTLEYLYVSARYIQDLGIKDLKKKAHKG